MNFSKSSTFNALVWKIAEQVITKLLFGSTFLLLAWFLTPSDFAIFAKLAVFIALSTALVDAGLGQALIRSRKINDIDIQTVYWTNKSISIFIVSILFILSPTIAQAYDEPLLTDLIRILSLACILQSLNVVQKSVLIRNMDFQRQFFISVPATFCAAALALLLAWQDYGVYSLIYQIVAHSALLAIIYRWTSTLKLNFGFNLKLLSSHWRFGKFVLFDTLLNVPFSKVNLIFIPFYYSAPAVGCFFIAMQVRDMFVTTIVTAMQTVLFPSFAKLQDDKYLMVKSLLSITSLTSYLITPMLILISLIAIDLTNIVLPVEYSAVGMHIMLFCYATVLYPIHALNQNVLKALGFSDVVFYIGIGKKCMILFFLMFTIKQSLNTIIVGQMIASIFCLLPHFIINKKILKIGITSQINSFLPSSMTAVIAGVITHYIIDVSDYFYAVYAIPLKILTFLALYIIISIVFKLQGYMFLMKRFRPSQS